MTPTHICNLALGRLGTASITSLDEDSAEGRACLLLYDSTRKEVLRSHRWNHATKRVTLTASASAPISGFDYQYPLPEGCLRVMEVNDSEDGDATHPWSIEGRMLLTDETTVDIVYVADVTNPDDFDSLFVEALVVKLAGKLTEKLRGNTGKTAELLQEYGALTAPLARRIDANEGRRKKGMIALNSDFVNARFYSSLIE